SSSRTGLTPKTLVYHASLAARSVTVTATCVMAGIVVALAIFISCCSGRSAAGSRYGALPWRTAAIDGRHESLTACAERSCLMTADIHRGPARRRIAVAPPAARGDIALY